MTLLSQFFQFAGARGKQLSFNPTLGWWSVVGKGEIGRGGDWLNTIFIFKDYFTALAFTF